MKDTIVLPNTKPYFLIAKGEGKFEVVKEITPFYDSNDKTWRWNYANNNSLGILEEKLDLIETPNIEFSVIVRSPVDHFSLPYVVQVLKNLAEKSNHDCFSYNRFGNYIARVILEEGDVSLHEVKPRLFRLKPLDDIL